MSLLNLSTQSFEMTEYSVEGLLPDIRLGVADFASVGPKLGTNDGLDDSARDEVECTDS